MKKSETDSVSNELEFSLAFVSLYVVFGLLGKVKRYEKITKINDIVVYILIFSISSWAGSSVPLDDLPTLLGYSILGSIVVILVTYTVGFFWYGRGRVEIRKKDMADFQYKYGIPFLVGWVIGVFLRPSFAFSSLINIELLILASFLGYSTSNALNLKVIRESLSKSGISLSIVVIGNLLSGVILYGLKLGDLKMVEVITMGSGWYTFTGPLVATYYSPFYGSLAFLINFFREQFSYIVVPFLLRVRYSPYSAIAVGGATAMDTTLPLYSTLLGSDYVMTAVFSGVVLTSFIPILLPLMLNLP